eukprot:9286312-Pyramimonas_sp.AAC.1
MSTSSSATKLSSIPMNPSACTASIVSLQVPPPVQCRPVKFERVQRTSVKLVIPLHPCVWKSRSML